MTQETETLKASGTSHQQQQQQQEHQRQRGALIVFEGGDRAGKSTQVQLLAAALQADGLPTRTCRFPSIPFPSLKNLPMDCQAKMSL